LGWVWARDGGWARDGVWAKSGLELRLTESRQVRVRAKEVRVRSRIRRSGLGLPSTEIDRLGLGLGSELGLPSTKRRFQGQG
jgi:hypothetical protein